MSLSLPLKIFAHVYRLEFVRGIGYCWVRSDYATHGTQFLVSIRLAFTSGGRCNAHIGDVLGDPDLHQLGSVQV